MNQAVTDYIQKIDQDWQAQIAAQLRQAVLQAIPDVEERIQYGKPHFLKHGKYAAVLGTAKGWVSFTIFNATNLNATDGLFEPDGPPERKTIKVRSGQTVDMALIESLVQQAASGL